MFGGSREKQRQYSSVSTEEGRREGPEVRLNNFWPIMLMVFIGLMTLPTLIVSAVTLARVPEDCDVSGITASLDEMSRTALSSAVNSLSNSASNFNIHNTNLSNAIGKMISGTVTVKTAGGSKASGSSNNPSIVCTTSTSPNILRNPMYLIEHGATSTSTSILLAKICNARCAASTHTTVFFPETTSSLTTTNPLEVQTLMLNAQTGTTVSEQAILTQSSTPGQTTVTVPIPTQSSMRVLPHPTRGEDEYTLGVLTYTVDDTNDLVVQDSVRISFQETYATNDWTQSPGVIPTQLIPQTYLSGSNLKIVTTAELTNTYGIAVPSGMTCPS
jgi:hypothetical protein